MLECRIYNWFFSGVDVMNLKEAKDCIREILRRYNDDDDTKVCYRNQIKELEWVL